MCIGPPVGVGCTDADSCKIGHQSMQGTLTSSRHQSVYFSNYLNHYYNFYYFQNFKNFQKWIVSHGCLRSPRSSTWTSRIRSMETETQVTLDDGKQFIDSNVCK